MWWFYLVAATLLAIQGCAEKPSDWQVAPLETQEAMAPCRNVTDKQIKVYCFRNWPGNQDYEVGMRSACEIGSKWVAGRPVD